jgi:hypothetical protein
VLVGQDWDTIAVDSGLPGLTRTIVHAGADRLPSPRAARAYRRLLLDAGFREVSIEVHTLVFTGEAGLPVIEAAAGPGRAAGAITAEQAEAWLSEQHERARTDRLFLAVPFFMAAGTR